MHLPISCVIFIIFYAHSHKAAGMKIEAKQMRNDCNGAFIRQYVLLGQRSFSVAAPKAWNELPGMNEGLQ